MNLWVQSCIAQNFAYRQREEEKLGGECPFFLPASKPGFAHCEFISSGTGGDDGGALTLH